MFVLQVCMESSVHMIFPEIASIALSLFTILVIINAFNLIDGINGLSGSIIFLICVTLGSWFLLVGETRLAIVAFFLAGAVMAFLRYNVTPAKIFMGDTGSLLGGLVCSILAINLLKCINRYQTPDIILPLHQLLLLGF